MNTQTKLQLRKNNPWAAWLLIIFLVFLGLGGLYGGFAMLSEPSGSLLQMESVLPLLPVPNYILPGLFLVSVMGITPLFLIYALITRPGWPWLQSLFSWSGHHWAWTGSLLIGLILAVWLIVQGVLIGFRWPIQYMIAGLDVLILLFTLLPIVTKAYKN